MVDRLAGFRINDGLPIPISSTIDDATTAHPSSELYREAVAVLLFAERPFHARPLVLQRDLAVNVDGPADHSFNTARG